MIDSTVTNIAAPSIVDGIGGGDGLIKWLGASYALALGVLLVIGGRLGDKYGQRRLFLIGMTGFVLASGAAGLATGPGVMVTARVLQGAFGALLAPAALSLMTVTFADSPDRPKAFGIFAAVATSGASVGLLLGGALTDALSWRWCLYVNLVIAIPAALLALRVIVNDGHPAPPRIDWLGAVLACGGLFALVFGFSEAERESWEAATTVVSLVAAAVLLTAFVFTQRRVTSPLLPLHIVWDRARGGAYASIAIAASSMFAVFLFLTYFMQANLGYSPLRTGVGFLPMTLMIVIVAPTIQTKVLPRFGVRPIITTGMALGLLSMLLFFTRLEPSSTYAADLLPGLVMIGIGMPCVFAPCFATATLGVHRHDAGVASAMVNTSQQVGGAVGTAVLSTIFTHAAADWAATHTATVSSAADAAVHGYTAAFSFAAVLFGIGFIVAALILPGRIKPQPQAAVEPSAQPA